MDIQPARPQTSLSRAGALVTLRLGFTLVETRRVLWATLIPPAITEIIRTSIGYASPASAPVCNGATIHGQTDLMSLLCFLTGPIYIFRVTPRGPEKA